MYIIGSIDASGHGMGGAFFVPCADATPDNEWYNSYLWRSTLLEDIVKALVTQDNPHGSITNSNFELAATIVQHDVITQVENITKATINTLHDYMPTVYWQRQGSATTSWPTSYLLWLQALHTQVINIYHCTTTSQGPWIEWQTPHMLSKINSQPTCSFWSILSTATALDLMQPKKQDAFYHDSALRRKRSKLGL